MTLEQLLKILRRLPDSRETRLALRMVRDGEVPPAALLRRCGVRLAGTEVVA